MDRAFFVTASRAYYLFQDDMVKKALGGCFRNVKHKQINICCETRLEKRKWHYGLISGPHNVWVLTVIELVYSRFYCIATQSFFLWPVVFWVPTSFHDFF